MKIVFNHFTNTFDYVGENGEVGSIEIADIDGLEEALSGLESELDGKLNNTGNIPPVLLNPSASATTTELRASIIQILDILRGVGLTLPQRVFTVAGVPGQTYFSAQTTIAAINDGVLTAGMMAVGNPLAFVQVTFQNPIRLTNIHLYLGQQNGAFNIPRRLQIFAGAVAVNTGIPLYDGVLNAVNTLQTIDLTANSEFTTPRSILTFVFSNATDSGTNISVNELQLFGVN